MKSDTVRSCVTGVPLTCCVTITVISLLGTPALSSAGPVKTSSHQRMVNRVEVLCSLSAGLCSDP